MAFWMAGDYDSSLRSAPSSGVQFHLGEIDRAVDNISQKPWWWKFAYGLEVDRPLPTLSQLEQDFKECVWQSQKVLLHDAFTRHSTGYAQRGEAVCA